MVGNNYFVIFTEVNFMINDNKANMPLSGSARTETESNSDTISTLNGLIQTCRDGQEGFKVAAEGIERSDLKTVFYEFSQQRADFVGVLQELVRTLGGDPENNGSVSAIVHRGWMDIKSLVTGKNEEAILNECERGEDYAKDAYAAALKTNLPANITDILAQQAQAVLGAHNRIKGLRNAESGKAASPGNV